jgi:hypothetical protein
MRSYCGVRVDNILNARYFLQDASSVNFSGSEGNIFQIWTFSKFQHFTNSNIFWTYISTIMFDFFRFKYFSNLNIFFNVNRKKKKKYIIITCYRAKINGAHDRNALGGSNHRGRLMRGIRSPLISTFFLISGSCVWSWRRCTVLETWLQKRMRVYITEYFWRSTKVRLKQDLY